MGTTGEQRRGEKMKGEPDVSLKVKDIQQRDFKQRPDQLELKDGEEVV